MDGLDDDRLCNVAGRDRSAKIVDEPKRRRIGATESSIHR